jgi:hypothetical protein
MTNSASSFMAIMFGLAVFAIIVAVGWRSVQNRRILRLQGANGQETIIVAREDDDISSVITTSAETAQPATAPNVVVSPSVADPVAAPTASAGAAESDAVIDVSGHDRLERVVSSAK